jgi:hypothetical protein
LPGPCPQGDALGYPVKPAGQGAALADRGRLAHQHEERGLKGIFGRVGILKQASADTQDHGPMPLHENRKGGFLSPRQEAFEQLAVIQVTGGLSLAEPGQVLQHVLESVLNHGPEAPPSIPLPL